MNTRTCPHCGNDLVFKYGVYGQFIGCSNYPACNFTMNEDETPTQRQREPVEWDEQGKPTSYGYNPIVKKKIPKTCPYNKCDGSGLIPATNKDGKLIPYAWHHCDCHLIYGLNPEPECYHPVRLDDFDFPMSSTFRAFTYDYCGVQDPCSIPSENAYVPNRGEEKDKQIVEHIVRRSDLSKQEHDMLQQATLRIQHLEKQLSELKRKKTGRYQQYENT